MLSNLTQSCTKNRLKADLAEHKQCAVWCAIVIWLVLCLIGDGLCEQLCLWVGTTSLSKVVKSDVFSPRIEIFHRLSLRCVTCSPPGLQAFHLF